MANKQVKKYFVYDHLEDGFIFFDKENEAIQYLKQIIHDYTIECQHKDDIDCILMGEVRSFGNETKLA